MDLNIYIYKQVHIKQQIKILILYIGDRFSEQGLISKLLSTTLSLITPANNQNGANKKSHD